jgi:hypothetical protein
MKKFILALSILLVGCGNLGTVSKQTQVAITIEQFSDEKLRRYYPYYSDSLFDRGISPYKVCFVKVMNKSPNKIKVYVWRKMGVLFYLSDKVMSLNQSNEVVAQSIGFNFANDSINILPLQTHWFLNDLNISDLSDHQIFYFTYRTDSITPKNIEVFGHLTRY